MWLLIVIGISLGEPTMATFDYPTEHACNEAAADLEGAHDNDYSNYVLATICWRDERLGTDEILR